VLSPEVTRELIFLGSILMTALSATFPIGAKKSFRKLSLFSK
jgi:hypothetical protein